MIDPSYSGVGSKLRVTWLWFIKPVARLLSWIGSRFQVVENWFVKRADRLLFWLALCTACLAIAFVTLWIGVSLFWPADEVARRTSESIPLNNQMSLHVNYPNTVLADDKPITFTFTLIGNSLLSETLTITATTLSGKPFGLALVEPVATENYDSLTPFVVTFPPDGSQTKSIPLVNARTETSAWWPASTRPQDCLRLDSPMFTREAAPICLQVESVQGLAWRNFVNSTVNEKSPLLILVAGLLSGAGAVGSQWLKQQQAKKEQEESQTRQRAHSLLEKFCKSMRDQRGAEARQLLGNLQDPEFQPHLSSEDLSRARYLIGLLDGEISETLISSAATIWPNETAGALAYAAKNAPKDRAGLLRAIRSFPSPSLSAEYQQPLENAIKELDARPLQAIHWPLRPELRDDQPGSHGGKSRFNLFASEYAEEEIPLLFDRWRFRFWLAHAAYQRMMANHVSEIVWGMPGTGKTAFGLALGEYPVKDTLGCYIAGLPTPNNIQMSFARKLLTFVRHHPTYLSLLNQHDRHLLAHVLISSLGGELVLAELRAVPEEVKDWQMEPGDTAERQLRESNVLTQLRLLEQDVNAVTTRPNLPEAQWSLALARCAQSLEFKSLRLVLDAAGEECPQWLQRAVLPNLNVLMVAGIVVKIMVPDDVAKALQLLAHPSRLGVLTSHQLQWRNDQMREMIKWRHEQSGTNVALANVIADDVLDEMIVISRLNPRCFARLWNAAVTLDPKDGRITSDVLRQAEKQISCP